MNLNRNVYLEQSSTLLDSIATSDCDSRAVLVSVHIHWIEERLILPYGIVDSLSCYLHCLSASCVHEMDYLVKRTLLSSRSMF